MNDAVVKRLTEEIPEFRGDRLFLDLPYVTVGEFAQFLIRRINHVGKDDDVVRRSFGVLSSLFENRASANIIEVGVFEPLSDDALATEVAFELLRGSAREAFRRYMRK